MTTSQSFTVSPRSVDNLALIVLRIANDFILSRRSLSFPGSLPGAGFRHAPRLVLGPAQSHSAILILGIHFKNSPRTEWLGGCRSCALRGLRVS